MERGQATTGSRVKKRKAEYQDNDRLSKRLSLLNLERGGQKLYVPVELPSPNASPKSTKPVAQTQIDDSMQLDDTKHKVYIYDIDAELSDSDSDDGKLIFLPDIQKHLRETRIPPSILANKDGELAGNNQLVLYNIPSSLTVPEEQDSVRKAIIEARARAKAMQSENPNSDVGTAQPSSAHGRLDARDWYNCMLNGRNGSSKHAPTTGSAPGYVSSETNLPAALGAIDSDPDAMDLG